MEAPGCWHAATNWALNSAVYVLWVYCAECLGISNSLGMVCTIDCVHTILRDARPRFKTGLPDAYVEGAPRGSLFYGGFAPATALVLTLPAAEQPVLAGAGV